MSHDSCEMRWPDDGLHDWWDAADAFARGQLAGDAASRGDEVRAAMREMGMASICADERLGGLAQGAAALARVLEALGAVDASAAAVIYAQAAAHRALRCASLPADAWRRHAPDLADAWLAWPGYRALDEGSWPALTASPGADGGATAALSGEVPMLLLGDSADWAVLPACAPDGTRPLVLLDLRHPGVRRGAPIRTLGLTACGAADLCLTAAPCLLLGVDAATAFRRGAPLLAAGVIAMQCGVMRGSLQAAQTYAADRHQGGGDLLGWGEVRRLLSLMHERWRAARGLLAQAVAADEPAGAADAASAEYGALHAGALACELTLDGVQLLGGNGYMKDYGQERRLRDARQLQSLPGGVAWRRQRLISQALAA
ncbi:acyl-CoA dehydrogenase family protein [Aquabacterium sp.]|uniref:acyl-CoA dehydrogenase family protein n=1 Tax=Aquabacterium sp. TaxID=1872578 RepID=UPI0035B4E4F5